MSFVAIIAFRRSRITAKQKRRILTSMAFHKIRSSKIGCFYQSIMQLSAAFINRSCNYRLLSSIDHATIGCFHPFMPIKKCNQPIDDPSIETSIPSIDPSMPSIDAIDRSHRSMPSIDAIDRSHRSMPSIGPIDRCHRSVPSIDAIDRSHRSMPSIVWSAKCAKIHQIYSHGSAMSFVWLQLYHQLFLTIAVSRFSIASTVSFIRRDINFNRIDHF